MHDGQPYDQRLLTSHIHELRTIEIPWRARVDAMVTSKWLANLTVFFGFWTQGPYNTNLRFLAVKTAARWYNDDPTMFWDKVKTPRTGFWRKKIDRTFSGGDFTGKLLRWLTRCVCINRLCTVSNPGTRSHFEYIGGLEPFILFKISSFWSVSWIFLSVG